MAQAPELAQVAQHSEAEKKASCKLETTAEESPPEEEKKVAGDEEAKQAEAGTADLHRSSDASLVAPALSFKEESYYVADLKEVERKALQALKLKIQERINAGTFVAPRKSCTAESADVEKTESETKAESDCEKPKEDAESAEKDEASAEGLGEDFGTEKSTTLREVVIEEEAAPIEDVYLWKVPLLHSKGDERTDVILLKFLRARDFKVKDALTMLKNTLSWRDEFSADKLLEEDFGHDFDTIAYMHGCDREGRPVCYNHYGIFRDKEFYDTMIADESKFANFLRWRIQMLEKGIQKLDFNPEGTHSMLQVTDLKDFPGFLKWRSITRQALTVLQDNYPELVAKQVFINVPWYFTFLYSRYGQIITQRQKSKVVVARPGKATETLFKYISPEHVPVKYGGLSRPDDTRFKDIEAPVTELTIRAGEKRVLEIPVSEGEGRVMWDVGVVGWDVVYGEEFVPNAENGYTVIIRKSSKMGALQEPIRNSFTVTEPGKVVLTIDNSTSRKKRYAVHRFAIKKL